MTPDLSCIAPSGRRQSSLQTTRVMARLLAVVFAATLVPWAMAVTTIPLSLEALTLQADVIVHGRVAAITIQRDPERRIYTRVDLDILETWKGPVSRARFTLVHSGGTLGNERVQVTGMPRFTMGEELVAFAVLNPRGEGVLLSLGQGKFRVWRDPVSGTAYAANPYHGQSAPTPTNGTSPLPLHSEHGAQEDPAKVSTTPGAEESQGLCLHRESVSSNQRAKTDSTPRMRIAAAADEPACCTDTEATGRLELSTLRRKVKQRLP